VNSTLQRSEVQFFYTDEIMTLIDSVCCRYVKILYENKSIFCKQGIKGVIESFFQKETYTINNGNNLYNAHEKFL
jgi:hypothetical protein